jgi:hypothetical protein
MEPTTDTMRDLISYIDHVRKVYEEEECYEVCAEMVVLGQHFSDYVLGYSDYDSIESLLFEFLVADMNTSIKSVDHSDHSVVLLNNAIGVHFLFEDVPTEDLRRVRLTKLDQFPHEE